MNRIGIYELDIPKWLTHQIQCILRIDGAGGQITSSRGKAVCRMRNNVFSFLEVHLSIYYNIYSHRNGHFSNKTEHLSLTFEIKANSSKSELTFRRVKLQTRQDFWGNFSFKDFFVAFFQFPSLPATINNNFTECSFWGKNKKSYGLSSRILLIKGSDRTMHSESSGQLLFDR